MKLGTNVAMYRLAMYHVDASVTAHLSRCVGVCLTGGGGGQSHRREGELDGIDQDFDDTQVEVNLAGKQANHAINQA